MCDSLKSIWIRICVTAAFVIVTTGQCPLSDWSKVYAREGSAAVIAFSMQVPETKPSTVQIFSSFNYTALLTVLYDSEQKILKVANGYTFTGDIKQGQLNLQISSFRELDARVYMLSQSTAGITSVLKCVTLYLLGIPTIPTITADTNPSVGGNVTLSCSSTSMTTPGNHSLSLVYNWQVDGVDNPNDQRYSYSASRQTVKLSAVVKEDARKKFTCNATENVTDGYTSARSNASFFSVLYGPENMTFSPRNTSYEKEENTELPAITCNADCDPACTFSWTKSDYGTPVNNTDILHLGRLDSSKAGTYRCTATRSGLNSGFIELVIRVIYGPRDILVSPSTTTPIRQTENTNFDPRNCSAQCWECEYSWAGPGYSSAGSVLNLGLLNRSQHGEYTCTATNTKLQNRPKLTSNIQVEVRYGPDSVTLEPTTTLYEVDELTHVDNVICLASCFPGCSFTWRKQGQESNVSSTATLPLGIVRKDYTGQYTCKAQNEEIRPTKSSNVTVQIYIRYGPYPNSTSLSTGQQELRINENTVMENITCHADCYPGCNYTWTKWHNGTTTNISRTAILGLGAVNRTDAATYMCSAVNLYKKSSNTTTVEVRIHVNYGPDYLCANTSSVFELTEGDSATRVRCFSECFPNCSYTWENTSGIISRSDVLSKESIRRHQAGNFTFTATNTAQGYANKKTREFKVIVKYAPVVSAQISTSDNLEGSSLSLFCKGEGVPANYSYTGLTQTVGPVNVPNNNKAVDGMEANSSIHFPSLQLQDTGNYTCRMNNGIYNLEGKLDQTDTVELLVKVKPKVLKSELIFVGEEKGSATVEVPFYCYPRADSVTYVRYDGEVINSSTKYEMSLSESVVYNTFYGRDVMLNGYKAHMTILDLKEEDFTNYTISIKNSQGIASELIFVMAESIPSKPKYFDYILSFERPVFIWQKGFNGGHAQKFVIQVSILESGKWVNVSTVSENSNEYRINDTFFWTNISELHPGTYTARLIATNFKGETEPLNLPGNFTVTSKPVTPGSQNQPTGAVVGGAVAALVLILVVAVIIFIWKRRVGIHEKERSQLKLSKQDSKDKEESSDDEDAQIENPMYVSAGPKMKIHNNMYAKPIKKPKTDSKNTDVYSVVDKSRTANKKKKEKQGKSKQKTDGDIYENAPEISLDKHTYGNPAFEDTEMTDKPLEANRENVNKDGLIYADLAFSKQPTGQKKLVIHGDDRTPYAQVDFLRRADPLPDNDTDDSKKSSSN